MSKSVQRQAQLLRLGAVAAPVMAVVLIRFAGPAESVAATTNEAYQFPAVPDEITPESETPGILGSAAAYARKLFENGISGNPFPEPVAEAPVSDTPDLPGRRAPETPGYGDTDVPELQITAVMSRRGGSIAVINARVCAVGAKLAPGWTLDAVDEQARTVVIRHSSGRRVEMVLSMP